MKKYIRKMVKIAEWCLVGTALVLAMRNIFGAGHIQLGVWQAVAGVVMFLNIQARVLIAKLVHLVKDEMMLSQSLIKTLKEVAKKMGAHFEVEINGKKVIEVGEFNPRHNEGVEVENGMIRQKDIPIA